MSWNRWTKRVAGGLLAMTTLGGCRQQLFLEPSDYEAAVRVGLPKAIETSPNEAIVPPPVDRIGAGPATVFDPARPPRYMTLKEAIAIALEQGNSGSQNPTNPGFKNEQFPQFSGASLNGVTIGVTDAIRAFALDPANVAANIERSLSKFDARWINSMSWQKIDNPASNAAFSFQNQQDVATLTSTLAKPLPTGGTAGITFSTTYTKFPSAITQQSNFGSFLNPNYVPRLQFVFEQPLGQLFGVEINQLANSHPSSLLIQGLQPSGGNGVEGILLTRIRSDQARSNFLTQVNFLLLNVEAAYWNLYSAYYTLYAQEEGLRLSYDGYQFTEARVVAGTDPPQNLQQSRAQFELFRRQVYQARGQVLESERQLRGMLGLRSDDNSRIVPVDEPNLAQYRPDYYESANETIANRPELMLARQDLKVQQLNLILAKNLRKPDVRFFSSYDMSGIGTRLDGSEFGANGINQNALTNFASNQFNSWQLGIRADIPIGFRDANAQVKQAQLNLTRSYYQLRDLELKGLEFLTYSYRRVYETHSLIAPARSRREALQIFVYKTKQLIEVGKFDSTVFFNYLQVQRDLASAIADEFSAVANYNTALATLEFAKGTGQRYNNVNVADGPLPDHVGQRAAEYERERAAALVLRERPGYTAPPAEARTVGPAVGSPFTMPPLTETTRQPPPPESLPSPRPAAEPKGGPDFTPMPLTPVTPMGSPDKVPLSAAPRGPLTRPWANAQSVDPRAATGDVYQVNPVSFNSPVR